MGWQDIIIASANVLFGYSLLYQVFHGFKVKKKLLTLQTSLLSTIGLYALSIAYLTLGLYVSTAVGAINGTLWLLLFIQGITYRNL